MRALESTLIEIVGLIVGFGMLSLASVTLAIISVFQIATLSRKFDFLLKSENSNQNYNDQRDDKSNDM